MPLNQQRLQQAHKMMDFIDAARQASASEEPPLEQLKEWVRTAYTAQGIEVDDVLLEQAMQHLQAHDPLKVCAHQTASSPVPTPEPWVPATFLRAQNYLEAQPYGKFFSLLADSTGRVLAVNILALFTLAFFSLGIALANRASQLVITGQPVDVYAFSPWTEFVGNLAWWMPYALPFSCICLAFFVTRGLTQAHGARLAAWWRHRQASRPQPASTALNEALFGSRDRARATASAILKMRKEGKDSISVHGTTLTTRRPKPKV